MPAEPTTTSPDPQLRPKPSLRERKKERTRRTIRTEAFRLFREQGYTETTVEHIAEAADISPSTFFRYFPSKEQVVLADDLDPVLIEAFERQPADRSLLAAFRQATIESFEGMSAEDYAFERERTDLVFSVPELRGVIAREFDRNIEMMVELSAARTGRDTDDFEIRALAGALTGAMLAQMGRHSFDLEKILRVIDFLEAGMPI
ncbi:acyl-CoA-like ligand-binding transcription factor [Nocardia jejuensis]|uniref:acyl-CoA-like ligand-binding transcription factor n=1 Tax=Nocardia jejuensis TaxID=328049 RepID=UPI0008342540|nr:TetR family transcriptional regulator [Nocardia jejuensis]